MLGNGHSMDVAPYRPEALQAGSRPSLTAMSDELKERRAPDAALRPAWRSSISARRVFFCIRLMLSIATVGVLGSPVLGRDLDGRYKDSALHEWFEHLSSGKGLCCSYADGYVIKDADWESKGGRYRVRVPSAAGSSDMIWVDVPEDAVISEPNKAGRTMVWPLYGYEVVSIRCFMPGSMT